MRIADRLWELRDEAYAAFQARLTPGIDPEAFIGVRVPQLRALARELKNTAEAEAFMKELPHRYYDENMLHALLLSECGDFEDSIRKLEAFLPFVDNWAVCDSLSPKAFRRQRDKLLPKIREWIASPETYTCRFGMEMLMRHYLDEAFRPEYLELPAKVRSEEYYVRMMAAWFFATALAKQWESTVPYLEQRRLEPWVQRRTVQKARESFRITPEQKEYLKSLK